MLKVWHLQGFIDGSSSNVTHDVATPSDAMAKIDQLAADDLKNPAVEYNAFGLLDHDGTEWYDEEGRSIEDLMDERDGA